MRYEVIFDIYQPQVDEFDVDYGTKTFSKTFDTLTEVNEFRKQMFDFMADDYQEEMKAFVNQYVPDGFIIGIISVTPIYEESDRK